MCTASFPLLRAFLGTTVLHYVLFRVAGSGDLDALVAEFNLDTKPTPRLLRRISAMYQPESCGRFSDGAVYYPVMILGEVFRNWKTRRTARKAAVLAAYEVCGGPLGTDPWVTYYRACSADCEDTAGSRWTL